MSLIYIVLIIFYTKLCTIQFHGKHINLIVFFYLFIIIYSSTRQCGKKANCEPKFQPWHVHSSFNVPNSFSSPSFFITEFTNWIQNYSVFSLKLACAYVPWRAYLSVCSFWMDSCGIHTPRVSSSREGKHQQFSWRVSCESASLTITTSERFTSALIHGLTLTGNKLSKLSAPPTSPGREPIAGAGGQASPVRPMLERRQLMK